MSQTSYKDKSGNIVDWVLFKRVLRLAIPFKKAFIVSLTMAIILALLSPLRPYLIQLTIDDYIFQGDIAGLNKMVLFLVALLATEAVFRYNFTYITNWLGQSVIKQLRVKVFQHILRFRLRFFDNTPIGTATTRAINLSLIHI